ncbi:MAG: hypothetical protein QXX32_02585 [Thermofilum sp.]|uniref:hypothetical protein n=1 Tax=Thermofilum sp. TaxID=1961369 RepID=UPI003160DA62
MPKANKRTEKASTRPQKIRPHILKYSEATMTPGITRNGTEAPPRYTPTRRRAILRSHSSTGIKEMGFKRSSLRIVFVAAVTAKAPKKSPRRPRAPISKGSAPISDKNITEDTTDKKLINRMPRAIDPEKNPPRKYFLPDTPDPNFLDAR